MITTMIHGAGDRLHSYELLADAWDLTPLSPEVPEPVA
jgi:hypothetical protein